MAKHTQSKLNSLFQDTNQFNLSKKEYNPQLSMPGALERLDKDYLSMQKNNSMTNS